MRKTLVLFALAALAAVSILAGCKSEGVDANSAASGGATPPPPKAPEGSGSQRGSGSQLGAPTVGNPAAAQGK